MKISSLSIAVFSTAWSSQNCCYAFQSAVSSSSSSTMRTETQLDMDRRRFGASSLGWIATAACISAATATSSPLPANAEVFFDPAMYGDQEMRVGTVDTVRERTRRSILQKPALAPAFYQLALLDGLSFNAADSKYGPNGSVIYAVLNTKADGNEYLQNLQSAATVLIQAEKDLKKKTAVSIADCIAIAGAEAIESIGGPVLPVQLGRLEVDKSKVQISPLPLDILSGNRSPAEVRTAFKNAGLTEREMTALLGGLLTLEQVEKTRTTEDWKASVKPKFVERGKMGRMSDYKRLTDEDVQAALNDEYDEDPDDGWYIADSFGTRDDRFGQRIAKDQISEKNFNIFLKDLLAKASNGKTALAKADAAQFGWIGQQILDPDSPVSQSWLKKYADSNLYYTKDLGTAFNAITQLGAVYTGGKYENLLKNKPRKTLNDDDLNLF
ncbi:peroxidase [Nitzschia inconspicua]|uniref:Peroxidase n=1 Tax=Nitzschia inconspicua TaxID=303405 RepID=A0A9K3P7S8_9STRA|nr:peroxidase [Nitzschia inconspicua]KAG7347090.1 peroxidase [Nitzschia inconspicua]